MKNKAMAEYGYKMAAGKMPAGKRAKKMAPPAKKMAKKMGKKM